MDWSFQLYSARDFQPWDRVLTMLAEAGYAEVEGYGGVYDDPAGFRAALDRNGLSMPTGHFDIDALESDFDGVRRIAGRLGMTMLVCPYLAEEARPADAAGWKALGERLAAVGGRARSAGFGFAWHNHDFELRPLPDGTAPLEHILAAAPEIGWEIDVAWVVRGGADPLAWIDRHGSRIVAVHVKDIGRPGEALDEDGWSDVGYGTMDWPALMAALREKSAARHYVMEHDNPKDIDRFARRSIAAARTF